jgi:hypothetical protein
MTGREGNCVGKGFALKRLLKQFDSVCLFVCLFVCFSLKYTEKKELILEQTLLSCKEGRNEDKREEKESFKSCRRKIELLNEGRELEA